MIEYRIEEKITQIQAIHSKIFFESFPLKSYFKKMEEGYVLLPVVFYDEERIVGYCIVLDDPVKKIYRAWVGGVLPDCRNCGIFSFFYNWLIEYAVHNKYKYIEGNTDNYKPDMIKILVSLGFDIVEVKHTNYGDGRKICMRYTVNNPLKLRISLISKCNLYCFFCHHEGVKTTIDNPMSIPSLERLLIQAKKLNVQEITITGGEPLLCLDKLSYIIKYCSSWLRKPKIKVLTNGTLLFEKAAKVISSYTGVIYVHISIHTLKQKYQKLVYGNNYVFSRVEKAITLLNKYNISYRINYTVLQGINNDAESLKATIDYAMEHGAESLQFMELLVTKEQSHLQMYYCTSHQIEKNLNLVLRNGYKSVLISHTAKKTLFNVTKNENTTDIKIAVYRLSCRSGCVSCQKENDITIGSDHQCYPCYLKPDYSCGDAIISLENAVKNRNDFLDSQEDLYAYQHLFWGDEL